MMPVMQPRHIDLQRTSMEVIGNETLIYDELHHQAWCLNHSSACIWRLCDGGRTVQQIATEAEVELGLPVSVDDVLLIIAELRTKNLIERESVMAMPDGATRREMIGKAGLAAAALLPVIASVLAPPAHAQSGSFRGMTVPTDPQQKSKSGQA